MNIKYLHEFFCLNICLFPLHFEMDSCKFLIFFEHIFEIKMTSLKNRLPKLGYPVEKQHITFDKAIYIILLCSNLCDAGYEVFFTYIVHAQWWFMFGVGLCSASYSFICGYHARDSWIMIGVRMSAFQVV